MSRWAGCGRDRRPGQGEGRRRFLVLGNSHSSVLFHGVKALFRDEYSTLVQLSVIYCLPFLSELEWRNRAECVRKQRAVRAAIAAHRTRFDVIILAAE